MDPQALAVPAALVVVGRQQNNGGGEGNDNDNDNDNDDAAAANVEDEVVENEVENEVEAVEEQEIQEPEAEEEAAADPVEDPNSILHNASRMVITSEERRNALAIKEAIASRSDIYSVSDFMCAQLAIMERTNTEAALDRRCEDPVGVTKGL